MLTAMTPNLPDQESLGDLASRVVPAGDMPWVETPFPGVEIKTLLVDRASGLLTLLLRMAPGAILPDHEHVRIEQTYMLEGRLEDKEGPEAGLSVGPGEFVWRPAGSRHVAWTPEGALMVAFFLVPNKFFDDAGAATDFLGQDWEETWGPAVRG